jgi:mRNA interferase MazF
MNKTTELIQLIDWNAVQARMQISVQSQFPVRKQIWWASIGQNIGVEVNGKNNRFERPVLVLYAFNSHSLLVAPLTSTTDKHRFLIKFEHCGKIESVNISQLRTLSGKRFIKKISIMPANDFERVLTAIQEFLSIHEKTPTTGAFSELPQTGVKGTEELSSPSSSPLIMEDE